MAESTIETQENKNGTMEHNEETHEQERFATPAVDIFEKENGLYVVADMPGLVKDSVQISADNDILTIKGVAKKSQENGFTYREFSTTSYYRQFKLGNKIDQGKIEAEYRNGVLKIFLPFAEKALPRKIEVKVST